MEQNKNSNGLCNKGCGFFGNDAFDGMCSRCFKEVTAQKQKQQQQQHQPPNTQPQLEKTEQQTEQPPPEQQQQQQEQGEQQEQQQPQQTTDTNNNEATTEAPTTSTENPQQTTASRPVDIPTTNKNKQLQLQQGSPLDASPSSSSGAGTSLEDASPGTSLKKRNRCYNCRKKVGLTGFECRCGGLYCGLHRYSDEHNCTFDYKTSGREQLAQANPVVVGEKVKKI